MEPDNFYRFDSDFAMFRLISQMTRFLPQTPIAAPVNGVARQLMERAEACAGRDPQGAQDLRNAARAYLSVVR